MRYLTILLVLFSFCFASPNRSLIGFQGLVLTPSAFSIKDGNITLGYRNIKVPYAFIWNNFGKGKTERIGNGSEHLFFGSLVYLPKFEFTGTITLAPGIHGNDETDTYKDLAIFAHFYMLEEKKYFPSIMLGVHDFFSFSFYNALFVCSSKSLNISKEAQALITIGYGVDWINQHLGDTGINRYNLVPHHLVGIFYGLELNYYKIDILFEYDTNRFNSAIRYDFKNIDVLLTLLNMDTFSFGISYHFSLL